MILYYKKNNISNKIKPRSPTMTTKKKIKSLCRQLATKAFCHNFCRQGRQQRFFIVFLSLNVVNDKNDDINLLSSFPFYFIVLPCLYLSLIERETTKPSNFFVDRGSKTKSSLFQLRKNGCHKKSRVSL